MKKRLSHQKLLKVSLRCFLIQKRFTFLKKKHGWSISFEFTAEGYENYFSIGNFYRNPKTKKQKVLSSSPFLFSYYYIDAVSIKSLEKEKSKDIIEVQNDSVIKTNEVYTFKNVLFNFDKAELLDISKKELKELFVHLRENPNLSIEIYGHTDNVGLGSRNKELSEQRAKAVADYLISQGLNRSRVESFGFGSSKPVSDNETEEGRQLNRRVEFKLTKN
ncbi:OmpA family protein [Winogradskyella sp. UBA3174]|uniref:OmpA family protein n=1 Tax=Winogradskyella sp. UBA3174 TaxID=1947785 RepID=UPI0025E05321|nr:OmpA family protein [Winogradskyella sp. UBA3174]